MAAESFQLHNQNHSDHETRRRVMRQSEPPSSREQSASQLFYIGKNSKGSWVVQDQRGLCGGLFVGRAEAIRFICFENGNHPEAIVPVPGIFELNMNGRPTAQNSFGIDASRRVA
jgi:hypothetical protein